MTEHGGEFVPPFDRIREEVMRQARDACSEMERAKRAFADPYSGHQHLAEFYERRGYWHGMARAVEVIDALWAAVLHGSSAPVVEAADDE